MGIRVNFHRTKTFDGDGRLSRPSSCGRPKPPFSVKLPIGLLILWTFCAVYFVRAAEGQGDRPLPSDETSSTPQSYSPYILTLVELARNAGATTFGTCKNFLLAVISRNTSAHASSLICAKSADFLHTVSQVRRKCFGDDAERSGNVSANKIDFGDWEEDGEAWKSVFREINRTLARCCSDDLTLSNPPRVNPSSEESNAADCLLHESLTESFNRLSFSSSVGPDSQTLCRITLDRKSDPSVQLPEQVPLPNNTDESDSLNQSLQELKWFITNLTGKENKKLNELRESVTSLYTLESSLSLTTGVNFNWIDTTKTSFLICNVITAFLAGDDPLPVCSSDCERNQRLLESLSHFLNISQTPIFKVLSEASIPCHNTNLKYSQGCVMPNENSTYPVMESGLFSANNTNIDQKSLTGGFCFTVGCKFPLQETRHRSRWLKTSQADLRRMHNNVQQAFPKASFMYNASLWPCGETCSSIQLSKTELRTSHMFVALCGLISVSLTALIVTVFCYNRRQLGHVFVFRVIVCYAVTGSLKNIPNITPLFDYKSVMCYSDGVLVVDQPGGKPICGFFGWLSHYFTVLVTGYFLVLIYAWQDLLKDLDKPGFGHTTHVNSLWLKYQRDVWTSVLVNLPPLVLTAAALAKHSYSGIPEVGACFLENKRGGASYFYAFYELLVLIPSLLFLVRGIRYLQNHKNKIKKRIQQAQKPNTPVTSANSSSQRLSMSGNSDHQSAALRQMSHRLLYFIVFAFVSTFFHVWLGILFLTENDEIQTKLQKHRLCIMTSCDPSSCTKVLNIIHLVVIVLLWGQGALRIFLLSSWSFRVQLLENVPCVGVVLGIYKEKQRLRSSVSDVTADTDTDLS